VGQLVRGKWRLDRLLGIGGCAAVYAATHRAGKRVAVKILHPEVALSAEISRRFLREAYAANAVEHAGVVSVLDDETTDDGVAFLVMDLLEGETLDARRKAAGGKLDPSDVLALADQILDVLAAAHAKNIIHRDLKPENLFLTQRGQVRILDFGIARFRESSTETSMTEDGMTMGSPAFMPPEQARGRWDQVDARTDIWAVGATLFTLLSGKLVHGGGTRNEALIASATKPAPSISTLLPSLPSAIAALVDRALAFDKEARWANARVMQEAVRVAHHSLSGGAGATVPLMAVPALPEGPSAGVTTSGAWNSRPAVWVEQQREPGMVTGTVVPLTSEADPGHTVAASLQSSASITKPPVVTTVPSVIDASPRAVPPGRRFSLPMAVALAAGAAILLGVVAALQFSGVRAAGTMAGGSASTAASAAPEPPPSTPTPPNTSAAPEPPPSAPTSAVPTDSAEPTAAPSALRPSASPPLKGKPSGTAAVKANPSNPGDTRPLLDLDTWQSKPK
jgi:serine/threonine-protein kinase